MGNTSPQCNCRLFAFGNQMEPLNGTHKTDYASTVLPQKSADRKIDSPLTAPKDAPAETFLVGRVLTRVWANPTSWGEIAWRIDQARIESDRRGPARYHTLHPRDLNDGMRGLYRAQRWIRRTERRRHRRSFWWW